MFAGSWKTIWMNWRIIIGAVTTSRRRSNTSGGRVRALRALGIYRGSESLQAAIDLLQKYPDGLNGFSGSWLSATGAGGVAIVRSGWVGLEVERALHSRARMCERVGRCPRKFSRAAGAVGGTRSAGRVPQASDRGAALADGAGSLRSAGSMYASTHLGFTLLGDLLSRTENISKRTIAGYDPRATSAASLHLWVLGVHGLAYLVSLLALSDIPIRLLQQQRSLSR